MRWRASQWCKARGLLLPPPPHTAGFATSLSSRSIRSSSILTSPRASSTRQDFDNGVASITPTPGQPDAGDSSSWTSILGLPEVQHPFEDGEPLKISNGRRNVNKSDNEIPSFVRRITSIAVDDDPVGTLLRAVGIADHLEEAKELRVRRSYLNSFMLLAPHQYRSNIAKAGSDLKTLVNAFENTVSLRAATAERRRSSIANLKGEGLSLADESSQFEIQEFESLSGTPDLEVETRQRCIEFGIARHRWKEIRERWSFRKEFEKFRDAKRLALEKIREELQSLADAVGNERPKVLTLLSQYEALDFLGTRGEPTHAPEEAWLQLMDTSGRTKIDGRNTVGALPPRSSSHQCSSTAKHGEEGFTEEASMQSATEASRPSRVDSEAQSERTNANFLKDSAKARRDGVSIEEVSAKVFKERIVYPVNTGQRPTHGIYTRVITKRTRAASETIPPDHFWTCEPANGVDTATGQDPSADTLERLHRFLKTQRARNPKALDARTKNDRTLIKLCSSFTKPLRRPREALLLDLVVTAGGLHEDVVNEPTTFPVYTDGARNWRPATAFKTDYCFMDMSAGAVLPTKDMILASGLVSLRPASENNSATAELLGQAHGLEAASKLARPGQHIAIFTDCLHNRNPITEYNKPPELRDSLVVSLYERMLRSLAYAESRNISAAMYWMPKKYMLVANGAAHAAAWQMGKIALPDGITDRSMWLHETTLDELKRSRSTSASS